MNKPILLALGSSVIALSALIATSSQAATQSLTVYSGRSSGLVDPIVKQFKKDTGIDIKVRYATDAALFATLEEEGARSPADVYWVNTAGTLVNAAKKGLFAKLPASVLTRPAEFVPKSGLWTPLSVRFRVVAFNPKTVKNTELPQTVLEMPKLTKFKGRIGWTPVYSSFQDFITAMRSVYGEIKTKTWLLDMKKIEPKAYPSNTAMLGAMRAGEIDLALTNHYYIQKIIAGVREGEFEGVEEEKEKPTAPQPDLVGTHYFKTGDVGNLELVTGAGILKTSKNSAAASKFLEYLLSTKTQQLTTKTILEYPVVNGFVLPKTLLPLSEAIKRSPKIDFEKLVDIDNTLKLLRDVGLL
jgi:iron(III) transport system substrate-binding protein